MSRRLALILLVVAAVATYWNALEAPFVWDDDQAIVTNQSIHDVAASLNPPLETPVAARPIVNLSLALNYAYGGLDPHGYHVVNLAILIACALLLFGVVKRTLARQFPSGADGSLTAIAFAPALLWVVHPLLSETVDYTTQRSESLMGLFFLLTLYASIRAREGKHTRRATLSGSRRSNPSASRWTVLAILSCAAGMATKESMVVAPIAVLLYDLIFEFDSFAEAVAARKALYIGFAATWIELGVIIWRWPRSTVGTAVGPVTYLLNQAQIVTRYLWLTVWPKSLVLDYGLPRALHLSDVILPGALLVVLLAAAIVALVRWPVAGFLGVVFFLTLAPTSSVVPILSEVGAERRMFLPLAALCVLFVLGMIRLERLLPRNVAIAAVTVLAAALAVRTVYRNRDYNSPLTLWQTVVDARPHGRARFALANQLIDAGRNDEALAQLRLAVADYPDARAGLGTVLLVQGQLDEGIRVLNAFVQADPSLPNRAPARMLLAQGHRAIAERELSKQNAAGAAEEARQSLEFDPGNADAHNVLGAALASQGNIAAAIPEFQAAVRINPQNQSAVNNLARAMAYARSSGTANTSK